MKSILKNSLGIILGIIIGSAVNMGIILISGFVIPPPEGADTSTMEGLQASMHLFRPKHFLMPFLAHSLGTFAGAYLTAKIATSHPLKLSLVIGTLFLTGGIINIFLLPSPVWFSIIDVTVAYIPMAYWASKVAVKNHS